MKEEFQVPIIYEDTSLLVVDKPAGMIVNKADTSRHTYTLQEWAEERLLVPEDFDTNSSEGQIFLQRSGIAHRIDKETSGILLIAKTPQALLNLMAQFKEGSIKKKYSVLSHGEVKPEKGEINVPIGRLPWNRKRFGVLPQGRESNTLYEVKEYKMFLHDKKEEVLSFLEAFPQTGRTHQIRVHLQYLGHPIFADPLYAGRKNIRTDRKYLDRQFLHASWICLSHPETGKKVEFSSPLPEKLSGFLDSLPHLSKTD